MILTQSEAILLYMPKLKNSSTYKKIISICVRKACKNETIETITNDGKETEYKIIKDDYFVAKQNTSSGELYAISPDDLKRRYDFDYKINELWDCYKPNENAIIKAIQYQGSIFNLIMSWGNMIVKDGDYLCTDLRYNHIYRIAKKEFEESYIVIYLI